MMENRTNPNYLRMIVIYLVVIAILIDSPTMYRYLTVSPLYGKGFGTPLGIFCLLYAVQVKTSRLNASLTVRFPILIALLVLYAYLSGYNTNRFMVAYVGTFVFLFVFAYALYQNGEMRVFLRAFTNVMLVVALISLFFWLFGSILNVLPGRVELTYDWAERINPTYTYHWLYFENPIQNMDYSVVRNLGIFTEAPGYSGFLSYAMLAELVLWKELTLKSDKRRAAIRILIFVITLISTSSTKGIIIVLIALAYEYITKETRSKWGDAARLYAGVLIVVAVIYATYGMVGAKLETSSGLTRMDDLSSQFTTFLQHPVLGAGYGNVQAIIQNQVRVRSNNGLSMGLTVLMAYGGLWMLAIYIGALVVSFRNAYFRTHRKTWFLIVIVLGYNLFISNAAFTDPYIFMVAAAYAYPVGEAIQTRGMVLNGAAKS